MLNETFLAPWIQIFVPQPCFDEFFVDFNFFNVECLKIVLSKCMGYGIILGAILVKLPQILKIYRSSSGEGISIVSVLLDLAAVSISASYGYAQKFPFSAYGEGIFLAIQTIVIACLVLVYSGKMLQAVGLAAVYAGIMAYLLSPTASMSLLSTLQAMVIPQLILSRLIQIVANVRNGSTGQLSAITIVMVFLGAVARIFTSIQETGDTLTIMTYVVSSTCNGMLAAQIWYYWNVKPKEKRS